MLYYIIPPLIIIVGLAVLASFLFRKVNQVPISELAFLDESGKEGKKSFWKRFAGNFSQLIFKILEKLTQKSKLYSLKLHNRSQNLFQTIKKRRERQTIQEPPKDIERKDEIKQESFPGQEIKIHQPKIIRTEEIITSPMVSRKVVLPEQGTVVKDRLEEALIERIATNPSDIEAYERLGDYYIDRGSYEEALECFRHVLKLSPIHRKARTRMRRLERMLGE